jgi:16S rRNA (cytosine967-C5)-methyltransferase
MSDANPRAACMRALLRWESGDAFADDILHETINASPFSPLDRAFFMEAFYGVLRNRSLLDFLISHLREGSTDLLTRQILRLGLYQIFHMRVPDHAAVNETVNLAGKRRNLVNAVLRRSLRERENLRRRVDQASLAVRFSHPDFLIERWTKNFGADAARQICAWNNEPAEVFVRANTLKVTAGELQRNTPGAESVDAHPLAIKVRQLPFQWIMKGLCYVQDPSTLVACNLLDPQPGETILDACAAPGGKTSYLAQLMRNEGKILAYDASEGRLAQLKENLQRLGVEIASVARADWLSHHPRIEPETFDRILLDTPCSNTGVIRRRVDVRWRLTADEFARMQSRQLDLIRAVLPLLKPGGTLVYSTCSMEPEENEELVARALSEFPNLRHIESRQTFPFRDRIDGAFAAKFERIGG